MKGLPRKTVTPFTQALFSFLTAFVGLIVLTAIVYYGLSWMKTAFGDATPWIAAVLVLIAYVGLIKYSTGFPELETTMEITELPPIGATIKAGLYYLLPVTVLVWCLTVERLSPALSALYATVFMLVVLATQRPLKAWLRNTGEDLGTCLRDGFNDMLEGMVAGSRNMIGIGVATAAAGIVVGTITLTGVGLVMAEFVEFVSGGHVLLMLIMTAILSLILGMGLPTTAKLYRGVVADGAGDRHRRRAERADRTAHRGAYVRLLFRNSCRRYAPIAMAAFAAAAISGGDPIPYRASGFRL